VPAGATVAGNPARRIDAGDTAAAEATEGEELAVCGPDCPAEPAD
jgi:hypothetical protein